jgi:hypothetical protein
MICIPMAGQSSRFFSAGYMTHKYQLDINGKSLFSHVLESFRSYFDKENFLIVVNETHDTAGFIENELSKLGIAKVEVVSLKSDTRGQAETVAMGLEKSSNLRDTSLLIFNIDTIRPRFVFPACFPNLPWVETFYGKGDHWSFIEPLQDTDNVVRIVEKVRISDLCCTGLYFFPSVAEYLKMYSRYQSEANSAELFIAPMYDYFLNESRTVKFSTVSIDDVFLCGTPAEFLALPKSLLQQKLYGEDRNQDNVFVVPS